MTQRRALIWAVLGAVLIAGLIAGMARAALPQNPVFAARRAAEDLKSATRALSDARLAKDRVAALSRTIAAYEDGLRAMREALRKAAIRERAMRLELGAKRARISHLLGVLQTLQRASTPLLLLHPAGPLGTVRSGMILSEVTPALQQKAEELRAQIQEILALQSLQKTAIADLKMGLKGVQDARISLSLAMEQRTHLPRRLTSDPKKLKQLADNSRTMTGFANGLADLPFEGPAPATRDFAAARGKSAGNLPLPVFGTLLHGFNEADAAGIRRPGIVLSAPPVSLVTTPWPATIRYRGPLLDYGNVIILEPSAGYLIVLAGLGQIYGEVGQILSAGDPVGLLRGKDPSARDFLVEASQGGGEIRQETLYIEIRKDRKPVDPGAWFALKNKVKKR